MQIIPLKSLVLSNYISADYYKKEYLDLFNLLNKYHAVPLEKLVYFITDGSHQTPDYQEEGVKFLMVTNLTQGIEIDFTNTKYISKEFDRTLMHCKPRAGDILFSKVGTVGIAKIVPNGAPDFNIFVSLAVLKGVIKGIISPLYLEIFLNSSLTKKQIEKVVKGIGVPDFHLEDISKILVIVPPLDIQTKIVNFQRIIVNKVLENEAKITKLEEEIEPYLYKKLEIKLKNKPIKKSFVANSYLERFDPLHESDVFIDSEEINNKSIKLIPLKDLCFEIISGQRPKGGVGNIEEGVPSLGGEHIGRDGSLVYDEMKYIPKDFEFEHRSSRIRINDILICKDGATTGKVGFVDEDFKYKLANINEHVFILRVLPKFNPLYIFMILKSKIGQDQILRKISGGAQGGITLDIFKDVFIPFPKNEGLIKEAKNKFKEQEKKIKKMKEERNHLIEIKDEWIVGLIINKISIKEAKNKVEGAIEKEHK